MGVDPALAEALGLDPSTVKMASHGGSGFASSSKLTGLKDGKEAQFFVKTGSCADAEAMFRGKLPTILTYIRSPTLNGIRLSLSSLFAVIEQHELKRKQANTPL